MKNRPELRTVGKGHSLFSLIHDYCNQEQSNLFVSKAIHRLCTLMRKMDVQTVLIENLAIDNPVVESEVSALFAYHRQAIEINIYRFTFLIAKISNTEEVENLRDEAFLSSAILINYKSLDGSWQAYLYQAIVTIPKIVTRDSSGSVQMTPLLNNYLHIYRAFKCEVAISESKIFNFKIIGTFFCQQNGITYVCAHAALCMTLNNMESSDDTIILPEDINRKIGIDHINKRIGPDGGLTKEQIEAVLKGLGLSITIGNFVMYPKLEYDSYIYNYVESRCPTLLAFSTGSPVWHVVPVLGHTLNSDMWRPEAEPAYSEPVDRLDHNSASAWVDHFIIHDDNFGMNFCLPVDSLKKKTDPSSDPSFRAALAVVIIPSKVTTPPLEARLVSTLIVREIINKLHSEGTGIDPWTDRVRCSRRLLVVRTLLVSKHDYKKSLGLSDFEGNRFSDGEQDELVKDLPELFWLSEITLPDLYTANKSKVIDFFYGCEYQPIKDPNKEIYDRWLQIRFPGVLMKRNLANPISLSVKSHYPLFRFGNVHPVSDW